MKPPYFIEILARNGEVLQRHQVSALPIRLGRGYDNDVILDDSHSAASHAIIEAGAGGLQLRDLGSLNGTFLRGKRCASVALDGDTVVRLGHTRLRVRGADHAVEAELADTTMHGWEGAGPALSGLGLIGASAALSNWLTDSQSFDAISYLLVIAYGLGGGLLWSAMWAFGNRLFGRHARLGRHLFIVGCGLAAMEAWIIARSIVAYAYSLEWLTRYGNHMLVALLCGMVYFHLRTVKPHHPRRLAVASAILAALGSGLILIGNLQLSGSLADEPYMSVLLPPALRQSTDHTPDEFFTGAAGLKDKVDAERGAAIAGGADADDTDE